MPPRDLREAAFLIVRRKAAASRTLPVLFAGLGALAGYLWIRDSFAVGLRTCLFLFPYLFLFLSQDMFRDEIDSGALENAAFVNGGFRDYLLSKMLIMALIGLAAGAALFGVLAACGLALGQARITSAHLAQFLAGSLAGLYYSAIGGYLSFFFRAGSNVLIVIIGQVFLAIVFFLSMTSRQSWVEAIFSGTFADPASLLRFLGLSLVFPNAVIVKRNPLLIGGLAAAALVVFYLEFRKIRKLELFRR